MNLPMYRQGDVLLVQTSQQTDFISGENAAGPDIVLAHGEKTGHTHSVSAEHASLVTVTVGEAAEEHLHVHRVTELKHPEHAAIRLDPGVYRVVRQRQYDPGADRVVGD